MSLSIDPVRNPIAYNNVQPLNNPGTIESNRSHIKKPDNETSTQIRYDKTSPIYARKNDFETAKQLVGERELKKLGAIECSTCANRTYQDQSPDPGVSMKSPTKVSPQAAGNAVRSHENEHVTRNAAKAEQEGREVVFSSVQVYTSVCPECGRVYVSGGKTTTMTSGKTSGKTQQAIVAGLLKGLKFDEEA